NSNPTSGLLALDPDAGTSEPYSDIVFTASDGLTTWRGRQDRTLAPTPYPSLQLGPLEAKVIEAKTISPTDDILVFTHSPPASDGSSVPVLALVPSAQTPDFIRVFALFAAADSDPSDVVGDVAVGKLIDSPDSPCDELAFAFGSTLPNQTGHVTVFTTCSGPTALNTFDPHLAAGPAIPPRDIALPSGVSVRVNGIGVRIGDLDGDGHADLFLDAEASAALDGGTGNVPSTYVAYGLNDGTFSSTPFPHASGADNQFAGTPLVRNAQLLAVGQLTAAIDPVPDFVFSGGILLLTSAGPTDAGADAAPGPPSDLPQIIADQPWLDARVADVDGDGFPDVIAGSAGRVDIYRSSGNSIPVLTPVHYAVDGAAAQFAIGDFDGDRVPDIAFRADHGQGKADLDVMWGHLFGVPEDPVVVGRFGDIRSIGTGIIASVVGNNDTLGDLGVVVRGTSDGGPFTVSVLAGTTDRQLQAPFILQAQQGTGAPALPIAFSVGQLTAGDHHPDLVSGTFVSETFDGGLEAGAPIAVQLAVGQSTGAAQLSSDPSQLVFSSSLDSFRMSSSCTGPTCFPAADWAHLALTTLDLDDTRDGGVGNGVDEIVGIAPALASATGIAAFDKSREGALFWARLDGGKWIVQPGSALGSLPIANRTGIAAITSADVNGDGNADVVVLVDGGRQTSLRAFISTGNGKLPTDNTVIALPSYSTDPGSRFQIVSIAAVDADSDPGKEIAMLTDGGGLFLAKSNAAGDSFTVTGPICNGGTLQSCADTPSLRIPSGQAIAATDIDGDGIQDLVIESNLTLHVLKGIAVDP
ncbi:MAG: VCBS repeat-containing protein, partial [Polyangiaceae bacterium]